MSPDAALRQFFGHSHYRPGQEQVVTNILQGRSTLAVLPTGGGKSICYQLPALLLSGTTLVISPLVALMKDQVDALRRKSIAAGRLDSSIPLDEQSQILHDLEAGRICLLYLSPERFASKKFQTHLKRLTIALVAVDEAHCVCEWGHSFRPDYLQISRLTRRLKKTPILALTATAPPSAQREICRSFRIKSEDCVKTSFRRPILELVTSVLSDAERFSRLHEKLQHAQRLPAIVYVSRQNTAELLAAQLKQAGWKAAPFHGGLSWETKAYLQNQFKDDALNIMVATIAFGMGVDKANVRSVFHYNLPQSIEGYQQEIGRAGRDGAPAYCEVLACSADLIDWENRIKANTPSPASLQRLLDHVFRRGDSFDISLYDLAESTDLRQAVVETVITYLEQDGLLRVGDVHFSGAAFRLCQPLERMASGRGRVWQDRLKRLIQHAKPGWGEYRFRFAGAADVLQLSEHHLRAWMDELVAAREIELRFTHRRLSLSRTRKEIAALSELGGWMHQRFLEREKRDLRRLHQVRTYVNSAGCKAAFLLNYFGENTEVGCEYCSGCYSKSGNSKKSPALRVKPRVLKTEDLQQIRNIVAEGHVALRGAWALSRFLCGISSPAIFRSRLFFHSQFGAFSDVPFADVLLQVGTLPEVR